MTIRDVILSAASPAIFIILLLSFVKSAADLLEDNNRRGISIVPYLTLTANCAIWTMYSILRHDTPVFIANFVGLCTGCVCTVLYHFYSIHRPSAWQYAFTVAILLVGMFFSYHRAVTAEGSLAMLLAVCIYGAPLVTLSKVIQERSTQSMPFLISFGNFLSSMSWTLYGRLVAHDDKIVIPSAIGWVLATIQMAMFVIYGFEPPRHQITLRRESVDIETAPLSKSHKVAEEESKNAPIYYQRVA